MNSWFNPITPQVEYQAQELSIIHPTIMPPKEGYWSGINGHNIDADSQLRTEIGVSREKGHHQLCVRAFGGAFKGKGTSNAKVINKESTLRFNPKVDLRHKYPATEKSLIPYTFNYFKKQNNPQNINTNFDIVGKDTRMELRKVIKFR
jgi:hypothetical protein